MVGVVGEEIPLTCQGAPRDREVTFNQYVNDAQHPTRLGVMTASFNTSFDRRYHFKTHWDDTLYIRNGTVNDADTYSCLYSGLARYGHVTILSAYTGIRSFRYT